MSFGADGRKGLIPFDTTQFKLRKDARLQLTELGAALCSQFVLVP